MEAKRSESPSNPLGHHLADGGAPALAVARRPLPDDLRHLLPAAELRAGRPLETLRLSLSASGWRGTVLIAPVARRLVTRAVYRTTRAAGR